MKVLVGVVLYSFHIAVFMQLLRNDHRSGGHFQDPNTRL